MSVDLSKAKAGDRVKFRCGGEAVIKEINKGRTKENYSFSTDLIFETLTTKHIYKNEGQNGSSEFLDIIAIEPAPFDWATVKRGMAWNYRVTQYKDGTVFYVGRNPTDSERHVFSSFGHGFYHFDDEDLSQLTRAPEHDIEVPS